MNKLKKLQYLNLAINNIEKIENLQGCESLEKLDLTLNFIGELESVTSLKNNVHLRHLYLTGNPCYDFEGYREYVIAVLPQITNLDCREISRSERIKSLQCYEAVEVKIKKQQADYRIYRSKQRERLGNPINDLDDETFWKTASENAPETRIEIASRSKKNKQQEANKQHKKMVRLFAKDGRPLNVNQAKVDFKFVDEDTSELVLDVAVYKFLDTNLIEVDVQPIYVKVVIKGKVFQFVLPEEVATDKSTAQRSQTTGHLVIKMPKVNFKKTQKKKIEDVTHGQAKTEYLEVNEKTGEIDLSKIVENVQKHLEDDDPDVPPLEYC